MKHWSYFVSTVATTLLFIACSGSSDVSFGASNDDAGDITGTDRDGSTTNKDGSTADASDSGIVCAPCQSQPPSPNCTGTGPCGCEPYTCPKDAGPEVVDNSCVWSPNTNPCGPGKYCESANCGAGTCVAVPAQEANARSPVCGCDGITYWNASVAARSGMSTRKTGQCSGKDIVTCGGIAGGACPNGAQCNYRVGSSDDCKKGDTQGTCWMTPQKCPTTVSLQGQKGDSCAGDTCVEQCTLIKSQVFWYPASAPCVP